jgi:uncharacterized protein YndB with AHSA1/START domain
MKWLLIAGIALACLAAAVVVTGMLLPKAHVATRGAHLKHPPEAVWALITGDQTWRPEVRRYEPLPEKHGRRAWKETDKHGSSITFETVESEQPRRLVTRIADPNLPFGGTWTYQIVPQAGGCSIEITEHGEVYNPIFRFVSRFIMGHTATIDAYLSALGKRLEEGGQSRGAGM